MNAERLMRAIGGISDRHIEEFAVVKPVKTRKNTWLKITSMAACICLVVIAVICLPKIIDQQEHISIVTPPRKTIWGDSASGDKVEDYFKQTDLGTAVITKSLKTAMEGVDDESALFAVLVTETTGKENEYVYNFIKTMHVNEDYMESGIIFLTESQINSLKCPSDLALILSLAVNFSNNIQEQH